MKTKNNKGIRLSNLLEEWNFGALLLFMSLKLIIFIYRLLPNPCSDGWRKTTAVHHRNDEAKYIGSLHNLALDLPLTLSKNEVYRIIIEKLQSIFTNIPDLHYALRWGKNACIRIPYHYTDIMEVSYSDSGSINSLVFHPDPERPFASYFDDNLKIRLSEEIKKAFNETCLIRDKKRSLLLYHLLIKRTKVIDSGAGKRELKACFERMLGSTWINFKETEADAEYRMMPHFFTHQKHAGFGLLNIHCRHSPQYKWIDIWMQFSHIGMDGRAAAKLQGKISNAFGFYNPKMIFPRDFRFSKNAVIYKYPDRNVFHGCSFIDLGPVISAANKLGEMHGKVLPIALLVWGLARHPFFNNVKFNIPVDIPAQGCLERTVGFVFIKPEKFLNEYSENEAFIRFNQSFNDQVKGIRNRQIENYYLMQTSTMVSYKIIGLILKYLPGGLYAFTGKTCVTLMEGIEYAIPSLSDNVDTIIAVSLMTRNGNTLACFSLRTRRDIAEKVLSVVNEVVYNIHHTVQFENLQK